MLEELFNLVKEQAQGAIINNDAVPNEHNDAAIQEITNAIHSGLSEHISGGNLEGIMQMFQGQGGDISGHPMVQNIISTAASSLASKYGIDSAQATSIASSLVPQVMGHLTGQGSSTFDLNSVISSFTGGSSSSGGLGGLISGFMK